MISNTRLQPLFRRHEETLPFLLSKKCHFDWKRAPRLESFPQIVTFQLYREVHTCISH